MTGRPQRLKAKTVLQARISKEAYDGVKPLVSHEGQPFRSFSHLCETLIFWMEAIYIEGGDRELVYSLCDIKAKYLLTRAGNPTRPPQHNLRATIDSAALTFLKLLAQKHQAAFDSRNEVVELMFLYAGSFCIDRQHRIYLLKRLRQVMVNHPAREHGMEREWEDPTR